MTVRGAKPDENKHTWREVWVILSLFSSEAILMIVAEQVIQEVNCLV